MPEKKTVKVVLNKEEIALLQDCLMTVDEDQRDGLWHRLNLEFHLENSELSAKAD